MEPGTLRLLIFKTRVLSALLLLFSALFSSHQLLSLTSTRFRLPHLPPTSQFVRSGLFISRGLAHTRGRGGVRPAAGLDQPGV